MASRDRHASIALAGLIAGTLALSAPALAQSDWETEEIPDRLDETLRGLLDRMKPTLEDMFDLLGVLDEIDSPSHYQKPEILPNGDILIRRAPDAPDWPPEDEAEPERAPSDPIERHLDPDDATRI